jgi:hypothetical protein
MTTDPSQARPGNQNAVKHGFSSEARIRPVARTQKRRLLRQIGLAASDLDGLGRALLDNCHVRRLGCLQRPRLAARRGSRPSVGGPSRAASSRLRDRPSRSPTPDCAVEHRLEGVRVTPGGSRAGGRCVEPEDPGRIVGVLASARALDEARHGPTSSSPVMCGSRTPSRRPRAIRWSMVRGIGQSSFVSSPATSAATSVAR